MILLKEIDPNYETPASNNLVLQQLPAILFGAPLLLLMTFGASGGLKNALIMLGIVSGLFILFKLQIFQEQKFPTWNQNGVLSRHTVCVSLMPFRRCIRMIPYKWLSAATV